MKKLILKSAFIALAVLLIGGQAFADGLQVKAGVKMELDVWNSETGFSMVDKGQTDPDMLEFSVAGEKAGAFFRLYANVNGGSPVSIRQAYLWLSPIDIVKLSVGRLSVGLFTEQLDWWQVPDAAGGWSSAAMPDAEGSVLAELTPVEGLTIAAQLSPGYGNALMDADGLVGANTKWGLLAKYDVAGLGTVGAAFKDTGENAAKDARIGTTITAVSGLYAHLQGILRFEYDGSAYAMNGVAIDTYAAYSMDALTLKLHLPVTLRIPDTEASFLGYDIKGSYALDAVTPYLRLEQNSGFTFDENLAFTPKINLGMEWGYDLGSFDLSFQLNVPAEGADMTWSIPFKATVAF